MKTNAKESAMERGFQDALAGVLVGDNPYDEADERHWQWLEGWTAAAIRSIKPTSIREMFHAE